MFRSLHQNKHNLMMSDPHTSAFFTKHRCLCVCMCVNKLQNRCCCLQTTKGFCIQLRSTDLIVPNKRRMLFLPLFVFDANRTEHECAFTNNWPDFCCLCPIATSRFNIVFRIVKSIRFIFCMHNVCAPAYFMCFWVWFGFEIYSNVMPCKFNLVHVHKHISQCWVKCDS